MSFGLCTSRYLKICVLFTLVLPIFMIFLCTEKDAVKKGGRKAFAWKVL